MKASILKLKTIAEYNPLTANSEGVLNLLKNIIAKIPETTYPIIIGVSYPKAKRDIKRIDELKKIVNLLP